MDGTPGDVIDNRLGSGSDYTVFLNFLGVPVADISFEGPYGVYHSVYDTHNWVARFGDPGFRYHLALVQLLGLATMRLAGADVVPLDYEPYAQRIEDFAADAERLWMQRPGGSGAVDAMAPVREAASELRSAAARFNARRQAALQSGTDEGFIELNRQLVSVERALLDPDGLPGRPWYRHLIYAPKFTYAPEMLPGVTEAVIAGDDRRAQDQVVAAHRCAASRRVLPRRRGEIGAGPFVQRKPYDPGNSENLRKSVRNSVASPSESSHTIRPLLRRRRRWMPA